MSLIPHLNTIAKNAYDKFREGKGASWESLPEPGRIAWRDRVVATERMLKKSSLPAKEEDCALQAIKEFLSGQAAPVQPAAAPAPSETKSTPTPKKKEK